MGLRKKMGERERERVSKASMKPSVSPSDYRNVFLLIIIFFLALQNGLS